MGDHRRRGDDEVGKRRDRSLFAQCAAARRATGIGQQRPRPARLQIGDFTSFENGHEAVLASSTSAIDFGLIDRRAQYRRSGSILPNAFRFAVIAAAFALTRFPSGDISMAA